jgi:hypothetical protein
MLVSTTAFASEIDVQLNGKNINFVDENGNKVNPQIINNRTMVPMRKIFEELGATINWNPDTKTVIANKDDTIIKLQINNKRAEKIISGKTTQINLDSEPIIINDRTLVPVRFIAESLEKQVGWDASNRTVVIIDYKYFIEELKSTSPALYDIISAIDGQQTYSKNSNITFSRIYTDLLNNYSDATNMNMIIEENVIDSSSNQKINLSFTGNSQLVKEIIGENWANSEITLNINKDSYNYSTNNNVLAKILGINVNELKLEKFEVLQLNGSEDKRLEDVLQLLSTVKENEITVNTFNELQNDFNNLCNVFKISKISINAGEETTYNWSFNTSDLRALSSRFDFSKLDEVVYRDTFISANNFINAKIFNYDFDIDEIIYDTLSNELSGNMTFVIKDNKLKTEEIDIKLQSINNYDEKFEYKIKISGGIK